MAGGSLCLAAFMASYVGFAAFALRQAPHHAAVAGLRRAQPPEAVRRRNLWLGTAALGAGFGACVLARGASFGVILWVLSLAVGGLAVMFTLSFRPLWLRPLARGLAGLTRAPEPARNARADAEGIRSTRS